MKDLLEKLLTQEGMAQYYRVFDSLEACCPYHNSCFGPPSCRPAFYKAPPAFESL